MDNKQYSPKWEVDFSNPNANNITTGTITGKPMENKQQTAIDWFFTQILGSLHSTMSKADIDKVLQQAKEMEKEQIIDACFEGMCCFPIDANRGRAEQYYNKTYNK